MRLTHEIPGKRAMQNSTAGLNYNPITKLIINKYKLIVRIYPQNCYEKNWIPEKCLTQGKGLFII